MELHDAHLKRDKADSIKGLMDTLQAGAAARRAVAAGLGCNLGLPARQVHPLLHCQPARCVL